MPALKVHLEEPAFADFKDKKIIHLKNTIRVAALDEGMQSGDASVAFGFELDSETVVLAETSLKLFLMAADMIREKYELNSQ